MSPPGLKEVSPQSQLVPPVGGKANDAPRPVVPALWKPRTAAPHVLF